MVQPGGIGDATPNAISRHGASPDRSAGALVILVNPFSRGTTAGAASGIDVYCRTVAAFLEPWVRLDVIDNDAGLDRRAFQEKVRDLLARHHPDDVVVEAPEARAATLLLPEHYAVHVRVHCPLALAQYHDGVPIDHDAFHEELAVVRRARLVSVPSHVMARELQDALPAVAPLIFPNPPPAMTRLPAYCKDIDVLVLGRAQRLKGTDYLAPILRSLPADFRVTLVGRGMDELPLGRGIRCQVDRRGEVRGEARFELLARARATLVPSRFESFSMVAVESLACGTTAVVWDGSAAAELAPPPLVRVAPAGDIDAIAHVLTDTCRAGVYPSPEEFAAQVQQLRDGFERGARHVIAHAHSRSRPPFPSPPDRSREHPGHVPPAPRLGRILHGEANMHQRSYPDRLRRKLRKLQRDPAAFFRDAKLPMVGRLFQSDSHPGVLRTRAAGAPGEPRQLGRVSWANDALVVERHDNKIAEPELATAFFSKQSNTSYRSRPYLGDILGDNEFIGFRDRYLFVFEYDLADGFAHPNDVELLFSASRAWSERIAKGMRNVVFVDPENVLPFLVRATNHDVRLIVFATDQCPRPDLLEKLGHQIDVLVTTPRALGRRNVQARRRIEIESDTQLPAALRKIIIDNRNKEKNMLLPVYGDPGLIEDIDELNERNLDGVLLLEGGAPAPAGQTFRELVTALAQQTRAVLLTEERFLQYKDYCEREALLDLLLVSLEDGCRYEVRP